MKKNKILFILHLPPPVHGAAMMGKYIQESKIINTKFNCKYINLTLAKDIQDIGKTGIIKLYNFITQLSRIKKEIKIFKPDLCYVTPNAKGGAFYKDFIVILLLKAMHQKVVIHYHNKGVAIKQNNFFDNFLYKIFFKNLKVILLAEQLFSDIQKYVDKKNVYYCPNGIPQQTKNIIKIRHEDFNILFLSNMMKEKGVWDLVNACKILKNKGKVFTCSFVGKWSDITEHEFQKQIHLANLEEILIPYGPQYGAQKAPYFQKADCFILPSHNECFPLTLLEAMEQGITCISTNEGGIPSIIEDKKTGYIIPKQSPEDLANKIEELMLHPEKCTSMGEAGKRKFEKEFTLHTFECHITEILSDIIS